LYEHKQIGFANGISQLWSKRPDQIQAFMIDPDRVACGEDEVRKPVRMRCIAPRVTHKDSHQTDAASR
jgi:hypothetical protein